MVVKVDQYVGYCHFQGESVWGDRQEYWLLIWESVVAVVRVNRVWLQSVARGFLPIEYLRFEHNLLVLLVVVCVALMVLQIIITQRY